MRRTTAILVVGALALTGCSLATEDGKDDPKATPEQTGTVVKGSTVTLVTHDSFNLPKPLLQKFQKDTGVKLKVRKIGDALATELALTKDNPLGDAVFGIDNSFASLTLEEGVFADYQAELPPGADEFVLDATDGDRLTPVDQGAVCVNIDKAWFAQHHLAPPTSLEDLTEPAYKDLFVVPGATGSTPGMLFLLATMDEYGDDWQDYWARLMDNGTNVAKDWSEAYFGGFTAGGEEGDRPIVLSYDASPAFTIDEKSGASTTAALLDTCIHQVEYAGVLENAKNPAAARLLVDFLVSPEVQAVVPDNMFVFPVDERAELPADWQKHATRPTSLYSFDADELAENRKTWLADWRDVISR
jgi:thiamine transport system substrate-binding protein